MTLLGSLLLKSSSTLFGVFLTNKAVITLQKVVANFKGSITECRNVSRCTCDSVKTLKKTLLKMNLVTYGCQGFH